MDGTVANCKVEPSEETLETLLNVSSVKPAIWYLIIASLLIPTKDFPGQVAIPVLLICNLSVIENLNEAPSGVILSTVAPIESDGQEGDYYINTTTQTIYGPKTDTGWNTGINY